MGDCVYRNRNGCSGLKFTLGLAPRAVLYMSEFISSLDGPMCVLSRLSCLSPCDTMGFSPPGSSSVGFSRQEYWSGLPRPPPRDLPNPGIEPKSLAFAGRFPAPPGKPPYNPIDERYYHPLLLIWKCGCRRLSILWSPR